jgi:hypothetical protein
MVDFYVIILLQKTLEILTVIDFSIGEIVKYLIINKKRYLYFIML